jgi:hypothetical protein
MGLVISKGLTLRKGWQPMDPDAAAYITAVETADGQALEEKTKIAIDNFVLGCKADGIWNAIKASCILAGARTLNGALVPLVGTAPTNFNFVAGDYNRKTGLVGDGSTKRLDANSGSQLNYLNYSHGCYGERLAGSGGMRYICQGKTYASLLDGSSGARARSATSAVSTLGVGTVSPAMFALSRSSSESFSYIAASVSGSITQAASVGSLSNAVIFSSTTTAPADFATSRLSFYFLGESLDLALLDARVTDLINAFAAAIP